LALSGGAWCRQCRAAATHEEIGERVGDDESVGFLGEAPTADLGETEDPLDHADAVLDLGPHLRLDAALRPQGLVHDAGGDSGD
jgi:hypothetical protein